MNSPKSLMCAVLLALALPGAAQAQLAGRDLNGDGQVDAFYDVQQDVSWMADAHYTATLGLVMGTGLDPFGSPIPVGQGTLSTERSWVAQFDVYGVSGWRLPRVFAPTTPTLGGACPAGFICVGQLSLETELTRLYSGVGGDLSMFRNVQTRYWSDTYGIGPAGSPGSFSQMFSAGSGSSSGTDEVDVPFAHLMLSVWAVHDGDVGHVAAVPEPSTYALMLTGLAGLALASRRRRSRVNDASTEV